MAIPAIFTLVRERNSTNATLGRICLISKENSKWYTLNDMANDIY